VAGQYGDRCFHAVCPLAKSANTMLNRKGAKDAEDSQGNLFFVNPSCPSRLCGSVFLVACRDFGFGGVTVREAQTIFDAVDQRQPTRLNDIRTCANRAPAL